MEIQEFEGPSKTFLNVRVFKERKNPANKNTSIINHYQYLFYYQLSLLSPLLSAIRQETISNNLQNPEKYLVYLSKLQSLK